ncbi:MAG TPA: hypothetical protein VIX14_05970 [Terriglobales bacterium]
MKLDPDGPQYISANAVDKQGHAEFLSSYLLSIGADPVDLDVFRTLPSSQAKGAQQIWRLTNLTSKGLGNPRGNRLRGRSFRVPRGSGRCT